MPDRRRRQGALRCSALYGGVLPVTAVGVGACGVGGAAGVIVLARARGVLVQWRCGTASEEEGRAPRRGANAVVVCARVCVRTRGGGMVV